QIFSFLDLSDRKIIQQCSRKMKDACKKSDMYCRIVGLSIGKTMETMVLTVNYGSTLEATLEDSSSLTALLNTLRQQCRRVKARTLSIECAFDESVLDKIATVIDFRSISLQVHFQLRPSTMAFARRSGRPITCFVTENFSPDPLMLAQLPKMELLQVWLSDYHFSDKEIIDIVSKEHGEMVLPGNLSDPRTVRRLIEIVTASDRIDSLIVRVSTEYVHSFLNSIYLREDGGQLVDYINAHRPDTWLEFDESYPKYYFDYGVGNLCIYGGADGRTLHIDNNPLPGSAEPSCIMPPNRLSMHDHI
ncbi:hypothetical protein PFISCL1PPCAC_3440, partial [Pristionchus fissidentatus]